MYDYLTSDLRLPISSFHHGGKKHAATTGRCHASPGSAWSNPDYYIGGGHGERHKQRILNDEYSYINFEPICRGVRQNARSV